MSVINLAKELAQQVENENIIEVVDLELMNYSTGDLVEVCQATQGMSHVFDDPQPDLKGDFDDILKQMATNALTVLIAENLNGGA